VAAATPPGPANGAANASSGDPRLTKARARVGATFRALHNRNYRLFWGGQFASLTGGWMQRTAMGWLVLDLSGSPLALGTLVLLQFSPLFFFALIGGVLADRLPKARLIIGTQCGEALQAAAIAVLVGTGTVELWHLYVLGFFQGMLHAVSNPTRQAFTVELVGRADLPNAVALNSGNFNMARIVGPAVAGILIAGPGLSACFWLNAFLHVPIMVGLLLIRTSELHDVAPPARGSMLHQVLEGLIYALRIPAVFGTLVLVWAVGTFGFNFMTLLPLLARNVFDVGPEAYGLLSSFLGLGALAGVLVIAGQRRIGRARMLVSAGGFTLVYGLIALSPWYWLTAGLLAILGAFALTFSTTAQTLLQEESPPHLRGRIMSLYILVFAGVSPVGAITMGGLSEFLPVRVALGILTVLCLVGVLMTWAYLRYRLGADALGGARPGVSAGNAGAGGS
jgi:MFS family permease